MTEEIISHKSNGAVFISLLRRPGEFEEWDWFVQLTAGPDTAEEGLEDEWKARAHYREVCDRFGITVPYEAPTFAVIDTTRAVDPTLSAVSCYSYWKEALFKLSPGTDEALALRGKMMSDENFQHYGQEILGLAEGADGWIAASIRVAVRRMQVKMENETKEDRLRMMADIPGFGEF